ncbi:MAG TPA: lytic transglycosylase domain-containing protein, partial [Allosphingosinicella sp.]|nr:lytic transglycosylase domain-containing protein [Allosphingosinicella sp.]
MQQAAVLPVAAAVQAYPQTSSAIASSVARWNSLRQSDNLPFSAYASFLIGHPGWPGEAGLKRAAERQAGSGSPADVIRYFSAFPPTTAAGHAGHAFALQASGRVQEAQAAARTAWTTGVLALPDEQRLIATFGNILTPQDHDRRMDALLANGDTQSAQRAIMWASPARRPLYQARLALQTRMPDARSRVDALGPAFNADPGLLIDKALWLRNNGDPLGARQLLARPRQLTSQPANPEKFMEAMVALARGAANDRQWTMAYEIASQVDDLFPAGTDVSRRSYGERDEYTNLTWLAGTAAMRTNRLADAARMFEKYGRAAQSPQTRAKGFYWASRAAGAGGQTQQANAWLELAAGSPDQFYGQLALERLGRAMPAPPPAPTADAATRAAFQRRPLVEAIRYLGITGDRSNQTLFVRALAAQLQTDAERALASELGRSIGRLDMGVWAAREARTNGASFYSRAAFPEVQIPPAYTRHWALAHGIIRQESSFERTAVSSAGARGLMQLMPGTAQQAASRLGVSYALGRLTEDPSYNVLLGNYHLSQLMDEWGGNAVLVAAAYNAGSGNVRRWVRENGDPR